MDINTPTSESGPMHHNNDMPDPPLCDLPELVVWVARHAIEEAADKNILAEQLTTNRSLVRVWLRKKRKTFVANVSYKQGTSFHIGHIEHFLTTVLEELARQLQNEEKSK